MSSPDSSPVAFYVHHHGSGHATRAKLLAEHWPTSAPIHVFTSAPERFADWPTDRLHPLPPDTEPGRDPTEDLLTGQVLHYAPHHCTGVSARMAIISNWIAEHQPALFVVDLSVEIALFARLCGVPVALMRLHGFRSDPAHEAAFRLADVLLAPFPRRLEDRHTPDWVAKKTIYLGTFSRYDQRAETQSECRAALGFPEDDRLVTIINGSGGGQRSARYWSCVAAQNPGYTFLLVGKVSAADEARDNLRRIGYVTDTFPYLKAADVVIGSGGTNTMHEVAAAGARFLSIPEQRPFGEQCCKMEALQRQGLTYAVSTSTGTEAWTELLLRAEKLTPGRWSLLRREGTLTAALSALQNRIPKRGNRVSGEGRIAAVPHDFPLGG